MSLARVEHIMDDAAEASIPDWVYEQVTCAGCGCTIARDEAERVDHEPFCANCLPAAKHYAALLRRSDGAVAR